MKCEEILPGFGDDIDAYVETSMTIRHTATTRSNLCGRRDTKSKKAMMANEYSCGDIATLDLAALLIHKDDIITDRYIVHT